MKFWTRNDIERWAASAIVAFREYRRIPGYNDDRAQHTALLDMSEILASIDDNSSVLCTQGGEMQVHACGFKKSVRCHMECSEPVVAECEFELTGSKAGQKCARPVCARHSKVVAGRNKRWCLAHIRVAARSKSTE